MRSALLLAALVPLVATLAYADLYRWVDPVSGSIKYSNSPPTSPLEAGPVEVVPYRGPSAVAAPPFSPAAAPALEAPSAAQPVASAESSSKLAALETQWRGLLKIFSTLPERPDFERSGGLRQQLQAYETLIAELDRRDPAGAPRRRMEEASVLDRVRKGLEAQFGGRLPPVQK
jgi:hypothetical protein